MTQWYYLLEAQQCGPVTKEEILDLVARGTLHLNDYVWSQGMANWSPIQNVGALYEGAPPPPGPLYAVGPYAPYTPPPTNGLAIAGMVLGIVGLVGLCIWYIGLPCAVVGLILSIIGRNKAKVTGTGHGMAVAGIVTSLIAIILAILLIVLIILGFSMLAREFGGLMGGRREFGDLVRGFGMLLAWRAGA